MAQFTGTITNAFRAEGGVNIVVKGIEDDRVIVAPTGPTFNFDKKVDGKNLTFTMSPSSGTTEEPRKVKVEVKNGSEKVTTTPTHWEVEITGSSSPTEVSVTIFVEYK
jgi:hypothetical protein